MRCQKGKVCDEFLVDHHTKTNELRPVMRSGLRCSVIVLLLVSCGGCTQDAPVKNEIRSIKTITVGEVSSGQIRKFSGAVRAVDRSGLSFEVSGNVELVNVDIGAHVEKGQVLAELDKEPYKLAVVKAEALLLAAIAKVKKDSSEYIRQKELFEQDATSKSKVERAEFALKSSESSVKSNESLVSLAKRDLKNTVLYAPYNGTIGAREVEPFVEVRRGQKLFEIDAEGEQEVLINIPETIIHILTIDQPVTVSFSTLSSKPTKGKITEIGTIASQGNSFPVKVRLVEPPSKIRSGMTAEVTFELQGGDFLDGYPIPGRALKATTEANRGYVFVYQPDTSTVKQTSIQWRGVKNNMAVVSEGLEPGDILAVAGVSFLSDGMVVKLMSKTKETKPETLEVK